MLAAWWQLTGVHATGGWWRRWRWWRALVDGGEGGGWWRITGAAASAVDLQITLQIIHNDNSALFCEPAVAPGRIAPGSCYMAVTNRGELFAYRPRLYLTTTYRCEAFWP
jgi:hypothetical protein